MASQEITVSRSGMDQLAGLIDVMTDNIESLPQPVVDALRSLCDGKAVLFDCEYLERIGVSPCGVTVYVDGAVNRNVVRGDRVSRKVYCTESEPVTAGSFWIYSNNKPVCGWGDKPSLTTGK